MSALRNGILDSREAIETGKALIRECQKMSNDPDLMIEFPRDRKHAVDYINRNEHFNTILRRFIGQYGQPLLRNWSDSSNVYFAAYSMELGIKIGKQDMNIIRYSLKCAKLHPKARKQMEEALESYKNDGDSWDFESNSLETESNPGRSVPDNEIGEGDWLSHHVARLEGTSGMAGKEKESSGKGSEDVEDTLRLEDCKVM